MTVNEAVAESAPELAVMVVVPAAMACAKPWVGDVVSMVAVAVLDEFHVTAPVRFCVLPSL